MADQDVELGGDVVGIGGEQVARVGVAGNQAQRLRFPLPPIRIGGWGAVMGRGSQMVSASW